MIGPFRLVSRFFLCTHEGNTYGLCEGEFRKWFPGDYRAFNLDIQTEPAEGYVQVDLKLPCVMMHGIHAVTLLALEVSFLRANYRDRIYVKLETLE